MSIGPLRNFGRSIVISFERSGSDLSSRDLPAEADAEANFYQFHSRYFALYAALFLFIIRLTLIPFEVFALFAAIFSVSYFVKR
jgi:membrane protein YqaA with SNARE-associated domain